MELKYELGSKFRNNENGRCYFYLGTFNGDHIIVDSDINRTYSGEWVLDNMEREDEGEFFRSICPYKYGDRVVIAEGEQDAGLVFEVTGFNPRYGDIRLNLYRDYPGYKTMYQWQIERALEDGEEYDEPEPVIYECCSRCDCEYVFDDSLCEEDKYLWLMHPTKTKKAALELCDNFTSTAIKNGNYADYSYFCLTEDETEEILSKL